MCLCFYTSRQMFVAKERAARRSMLLARVFVRPSSFFCLFACCIAVMVLFRGRNLKACGTLFLLSFFAMSVGRVECSSASCTSICFGGGARDGPLVWHPVTGGWVHICPRARVCVEDVPTRPMYIHEKDRPGEPWSGVWGRNKTRSCLDRARACELLSQFFLSAAFVVPWRARLTLRVVITTFRALAAVARTVFFLWCFQELFFCDACFGPRPPGRGNQLYICVLYARFIPGTVKVSAHSNGR